MTSFAEQQATQSMNKASIEVKEYLHKKGQIEVLSGTGLPGEIPQIALVLMAHEAAEVGRHGKALLTYALNQNV